MAIKITTAQIPKSQPFMEDTKALCKQWSELESCHRDMLDLTHPKSERGQMHTPGSCHLPEGWEAWLGAPGGVVLPLSPVLLSFMADFLVCVELKYRILLSMKIQSGGIRCGRKAEERPQSVPACGRGLELDDL